MFGTKKKREHYPSDEMLERIVEENDPEKLKPNGGDWPRSSMAEVSQQLTHKHEVSQEAIASCACTMVEHAKALQLAIEKEQGCIAEIVSAGRVLDDAQKNLQEAKDSALKAGQVRQKLHRELTDVLARVA
jgi:hypothetical protein